MIPEQSLDARQTISPPPRIQSRTSPLGGAHEHLVPRSIPHRRSPLRLGHRLRRRRRPGCGKCRGRSRVPGGAAGIPAAEARLYSGGGGFVFANGRDARNIPFELNSDKIYVQVRLNDQGPFWMMLDTGSPGMVLDTATAARLGLPLGKSGETTGAGEATFTLTEVTSTVDAGMPGVTLQKQPAAVGPLDQVIGPFEGRHLEGLLGCHNLMTRFVVEIDYARRLIHFISSQEFKPGPGAQDRPDHPGRGPLLSSRPRSSRSAVSRSRDGFWSIPACGATCCWDHAVRRSQRPSGPVRPDRPHYHGRRYRRPGVLPTVGADPQRPLRRLDGRGLPCQVSRRLRRAWWRAGTFAGVIGAAVLQRYRVAFE